MLNIGVEVVIIIVCKDKKRWGDVTLGWGGALCYIEIENNNFTFWQWTNKS